MKKLIRTLLSVSLTAACFATDISVVEWDYLQPNYVSQRFTHVTDSSSSSTQRFPHAVDRFAEDIFTTSAAAAGDGFPPRHPGLISQYLSQFSGGLTGPDYLQGYSLQPKSLKLKTFRKFKNEAGEGVENILSMRFVERHFPEATLEISEIIAQYAFGTESDRHFKVYAKKRLGQLIDGYWKYLSSTIKQHFASSKNPSSTLFLNDGLDRQGVAEIAQALGTTASLRLEGIRAEHNHLFSSTMANRLLTNHVNDIAQEYGFRQKLEFNHGWGINFRETFMQYILCTCVEDPDVVLLPDVSEGFGEDFYGQQSQAYCQSYPIFLQVRLNPNGLPHDVERQFIRYFSSMYQQSLKQLR